MVLVQLQTITPTMLLMLYCETGELKHAMIRMELFFMGYVKGEIDKIVRLAK
jgi:hypothetical protein